MRSLLFDVEILTHGLREHPHLFLEVLDLGCWAFDTWAEGASSYSYILGGLGSWKLSSWHMGWGSILIVSGKFWLLDVELDTWNGFNHMEVINNESFECIFELHEFVVILVVDVSTVECCLILSGREGYRM